MIKKYFLFALLCCHVGSGTVHALSTKEKYAAGGTAAAVLTALASGLTWRLKRRARLRRLEYLRRKLVERAVRSGRAIPDTRSLALPPSLIERAAPYVLGLALAAAGVGGTSLAVMRSKNAPAIPPASPQGTPPPLGASPVLGAPLPLAPEHGVTIHSVDFFPHLQVGDFIRLTPPEGVVEGVWQLCQRGANLMLCPVQGQPYQEPLDRDYLWQVGLAHRWFVNPVGSGVAGGVPPLTQPAPGAQPLPLTGMLDPNAMYTVNGQSYIVVNLSDEGVFLQNTQSGDLLSIANAQAIVAGDRGSTGDDVRLISSWQDLGLLRVGDRVSYNGHIYIAQADPDNPERIGHFIGDGNAPPITRLQMLDFFAPAAPAPDAIVRPMVELADLNVGEFIRLGAPGGEKKVYKLIDEDLLHPVQGTDEMPVRKAELLTICRAQGWIPNADGVFVSPPMSPASPLSHVRSLEPNMEFATIPEIQQLNEGHLIWLTIQARRHPTTGVPEGEDHTYAYAVGTEVEDGYNALTPIDPVGAPEFDSTRNLMNDALDNRRYKVVFKGNAWPGRLAASAIRNAHDPRIALPGKFQLIDRTNGNVEQGVIGFTDGVLQLKSDTGETTVNFQQHALVFTEPVQVGNATEYLRERLRWLQRRGMGISLTVDGQKLFFLPTITVNRRHGSRILFEKNDADALQANTNLRLLNKQATNIAVLTAQQVNDLVSD